MDTAHGIDRCFYDLHEMLNAHIRRRPASEDEAGHRSWSIYRVYTVKV